MTVRHKHGRLPPLHVGSYVTSKGTRLDTQGKTCPWATVALQPAVIFAHM
jgi:hypothetical protein